MKKIIKYGLLTSIVINILFVLILYKSGGFNYIVQNINFSKSKPVYSTYYLDKQSEFDKLKVSKQNIVFIGDSLTARGEWNELLDNSNIINRGIEGDTTLGVLNRIGNIINGKPSKIFIMIGINDLRNGVKSEQIINNYKKIMNKIKHDSPNTKVYIQSILPINEKLYKSTIKNNYIISINKQIQVLVGKYNYTYINLFPLFVDSNDNLNSKFTIEGLHINGEGYLIWRQILEKYVSNK